MKFRRTNIILLSTVVIFSIAHGQDPEIDRYINYPGSYDAGTLHYSVGLSLTMLPRQIVEEEIRQIPMISGGIRYGLPSNFSLTAQLSTVYITSAMTAGIVWSVPFDNYSFSLSDELSYWFGVADLNGFDTKAMGLINRPAVSAGIDVDGFKITAKTEMIVLLSQHTYFGTASVGRFKPEIAGMATTFCLEQLIANTAFISMALRANYAIPNYQLWLAFSAQDRWLFYPELQFSILY